MTRPDQRPSQGPQRFPQHKHQPARRQASRPAGTRRHQLGPNIQDPSAPDANPSTPASAKAPKPPPGTILTVFPDARNQTVRLHARCPPILRPGHNQTRKTAARASLLHSYSIVPEPHGAPTWSAGRRCEARCIRPAPDPVKPFVTDSCRRKARVHERETA